MNKLEDLIEIADIHAERINWAITELKNIFPLKQDKITNLSKQELLLIELLIARFAKLQDFLGGKIINEFLSLTQDYADNFTMLDKLNKLERLEIIENIEIWKQMREIRNHLAHEYPNEPVLTARYLNQMFELAPKLLDILNKIKQKLASI